MPDVPAPDIAAIVLHYGEKEEHERLTHRAVETLKRSLEFTHQSFSILVVDDAGPRPYVPTDGEPVHRLRENVSLAAAFNVGIAKAPSTERLLLVTNDTVWPRFTVHMLLRALELPKAAIVAPMMDDPGAGILYRAAPEPHAPEKGVSISEWEAFLTDNQYTLSDAFVPANHVDNTAWMITRELVDRVGVFDEAFNGPGSWYANQDWCRRAWDAGLMVGYVPRAFIHHCKRATRGDSYATQAEVVGRAQFHAKWG